MDVQYTNDIACFVCDRQKLYTPIFYNFKGIQFKSFGYESQICYDTEAVTVYMSGNGNTIKPMYQFDYILN